MNHFKTTAISLLLALSLSACSDDDKDPKSPEVSPAPGKPPVTSPDEPSAREVTITFEYLTNDEQSSDVASVDDAIISTVIDNEGKEHSIRNDNYVVTIMDETGIESFTDVIIYEESTYSYTVTGEAEIIVTHQNLDVNQDGIIDTDKNGDIVKLVSSYFTASGTMELAADADEAKLTVSNEYYSMVSLDINEDFDIDLTINGQDAKTNSQSYYGYVTGDVADIKAMGNSTFYLLTQQLIPSTVYDLATVSDLDNPFILMLDWAYPSTPELGEGVINTDQIIGADAVSINDQGHVSGITAGKSVTVYHPTGGHSLEEYKEFTAEVSFTGADNQVFINVYLEDGEEQIRADYYPLTGDVRVSGDVFSSFKEFASSEQYKHYIVRRNYIENIVQNPVTGDDLQSVRGNFFLRFGDSNYVGSGDEFTILAWGLAEPETLPLDQILGATDLTSTDGVITGTITESKVVTAFARIESGITLENYDWSFDITTPSQESFVNIYLKDSSTDQKITVAYLIGTQYSNQPKKYEVRDGEQWLYLTKEEFKAQYGHMIVRQWFEASRDGFMLGNFIWRSSGTTESGTAGQFTINDYTITQN